MATATALAACSSDGVKETALEKLAIGTWSCSTDAPGSSSVPFEVQVREGGFSVKTDANRDRKITGTWSVEDGDLTIDFTGAAAGALDFEVLGFDELTLKSRKLTLDDGGLTGRPMEMTEADPEAGLEPLDVAVETHGTSSFTWTLPYGGDPWTCDRT